MTNDKAGENHKSRYQVLRLVNRSDDGTPERYEVVGKAIEANGQKDAIRKVGGTAEGVYVAVPARSWDPVAVKIEQTTIVHVG